MRLVVNVQTRLALIDEWRWELIHGEEAEPLDVLLYLLVKQNNIIVDGFNHREVRGHTEYIAEMVSRFYAHRPMAIPIDVVTIANPRIRFRQLRFDVLETNDACIPHERPEGSLIELARQQGYAFHGDLSGNRDGVLRRLSRDA